jgi:AraC family transcriptional regulator, regulatory protein of adaptative response / methylated-DNA-[protein]-cysteine methyltransferase
MQPNRDYARIEQAIEFLARHARTQPRLEQVAAHVGLSEYHFQRLFRRWAGISPKRFLQYLTAERARELLQSSRTTLDASLEAGLSGTGRLHDLMVAMHAATPGDIQSRGAGLIIDYGVHPTPFGECLIALTERGVCGIEFLDPLRRRGALVRLQTAWPAATLRERSRATRAVAQQVFADHSNGHEPISLFVRGTNFQIKVWEALLRVPLGNVVSYEDLARAAGEPDATRAVASAVAGNAVALLIPCHRVIRKNGVVGEYRWGAARKQAMLVWESARFEAIDNGQTESRSNASNRRSA